MRRIQADDAKLPNAAFALCAIVRVLDFLPCPSLSTSRDPTAVHFRGTRFRPTDASAPPSSIWISRFRTRPQPALSRAPSTVHCLREAVLFLVRDRSSSQQQKPPLVQKQAAVPRITTENQHHGRQTYSVCVPVAKIIGPKKKERKRGHLCAGTCADSVGIVSLSSAPTRYDRPSNFGPFLTLSPEL